MGGWKKYNLKDVAEVQTGPFGSQLHASDYVTKGIPCIMPTNIGNRLEINTGEIAFISESDVQRLSRHKIKAGDIVYSRRGDVEKCAYITENQDGCKLKVCCILSVHS
jgi:type I restriction enzyme S subunit